MTTALFQVINPVLGLRSQAVAAAVDVFAVKLRESVAANRLECVRRVLCLSDSEELLHDMAGDLVLVLIDDTDAASSGAHWEFSRAPLLTVERFISLFSES